MGKIVYIVFLCVLILLAACGQQAPADLILVNGRIFTCDSAMPSTEAVAIAGERIVAVGTSAEIEKLAGAGTLRIDLQRRVVVPGFNDAHYHFMPFPKCINLEFKTMEPSWEETRTALEQAVRQTPAGIWVFGSVGGDVVLNEEVTRFELDRLALNHPIWLSAWTGNGSILNSKAMQLLQIAEEEPDPMGGSYERVSGSSQINGRLWRYAQWRPLRILAEQAPDEDAVKDLRRMVDEAVSFGITSIQVFPWVSIDRFARLLDKANLPIRVRAIPFSLSNPSGRDLSEIRRLGNLEVSQSKTTLSGIKWVLDGTPIECGAALRRDYSDRAG